MKTTPLFVNLFVCLLIAEKSWIYRIFISFIFCFYATTKNHSKYSTVDFSHFLKAGNFEHGASSVLIEKVKT
jgi:hypothetical protein